MTEKKTCSFIGHRKIENPTVIESEIKAVVEDLIKNHGVTVFLFGSNSQFNNACHRVVTKLKDSYPFIERVVYTCKSEDCIYESERKQIEESFSRFFKRPISVKGYDKEIEHKTKYVAGKASYIERNYAMIDNSDYCIFYYNKDYSPETEKKSNGITTSSKSGTKLAYTYAVRKKKV